MLKLAKIAGYALLVPLGLAAAGITATIGWRPFLGPKARPLTDRKFQAAPERLQRGTYFVEHVAGCMECHSPHDWSKHDAPIPEGMKGAGTIFPLKGLPGRLVAPNLTPDPETGAGHDGRALFPLMPYQRFREMSDEDLASVIVYLRSLQPVRNPLPKSEIIFPVKYLIRNVPQPVLQPVSAPGPNAGALSRGRYQTQMASCIECHTPKDEHGQPIPGLEFGGGFILEGPWGRVASANITSDPAGISYYTREMFIQTIRTGTVGGVRELAPIMPWHVFRGMTDEDLSLIFTYLQSVKPVHHSVDNTEQPTYCRLCRNMHGLGERN
jgi:mono/diheme cytochrome c family protein